MTPAAQLAAISQRVASHGPRAGRGRRARRCEALAGHGLAVLEPREWTASQRQFLQAHFAKEILPVLTPLAVQELDPPPLLPGQQWYVAAVLAGGRTEPPAERIVVVPVPSQFPRWISVPAEQGVCLARLDDVIAANAAAVLPRLRGVGHGGLPHHPRRRRGGATATRRATCSMRWRRRCWTGGGARPVRLKISARPDRRIRQWLAEWLQLGAGRNLRDRPDRWTPPP